MSLLEVLSGGDPRSLGRNDEVVAAVLEDRDSLPELLDCLLADDEIVRMRAADALEKISSQHPEWLRPQIDWLLEEVAQIKQPSVQWHLAQILGEVELSAAQRKKAIQYLKGQVSADDDWIVIRYSLDTLTQFAQSDRKLREYLIPVLEQFKCDRRKAIAKRAGKLIESLERVKEAK